MRTRRMEPISAKPRRIASRRVAKSTLAHLTSTPMMTRRIGSVFPRDREFCKFTSKKDGSRIHVLLSTLYTEKPTLAALAYYAEVPYGGNCNGNPASCYCSQLGGSDLFGGINLNGGGWVLGRTRSIRFEACIFPDMSSIDSWGLTYHQAKIIRGKNLANVLRYPNPYGTQ